MKEQPVVLPTKITYREKLIGGNLGNLTKYAISLNRQSELQGARKGFWVTMGFQKHLPSLTFSMCDQSEI